MLDDLARLKQDTLDALNRVRRQLKLEPLEDLPKGTPGEAEVCPVHNTIPGCRIVGPILTSFEHEQSAQAFANIFGGLPERASTYFVVDTPPLVKSFAEAFDRRQFPDLIEQRA